MNNIFELLFIKGEKYPSVLSEDQSYSPCVNMFKMHPYLQMTLKAKRQSPCWVTLSWAAVAIW